MSDLFNLRTLINFGRIPISGEGLEMKWYKHDTTANMDDRLQEVLLDYGLEGYGLYWYCLELIALNVTPENLTFELKHDARIIARNTGCTVQKVEEMMTRFVEIGLFEADNGHITCLKLAKRADDYTAKLVRLNRTQAIDNKGVPETPIKSDKVPSDKNRLDKNRLDKNRLDKNKKTKKQKDVVLPENLNLEAWEEFIQHRKSKNTAFSNIAKQKAINILVKHPRNVQQMMIDKSIVSNWAGVFEPSKQELDKIESKNESIVDAQARFQDRGKAFEQHMQNIGYFNQGESNE